jgi:iron complex transport system substrate-binding protein
MKKSDKSVKFPFFVLILFLFALQAAAGRGVSENSDTVNQENSVVKYDRIVQAGPSAFLVEDALYLFPEAKERVVAMADGNQGSGFFIGDIDTNIKNKKVISRRAGTEEILSLKPDIVVMKNFLKSKMGEPLEKLGVPVMYLNLEDPDSWLDDVDRLGELLGDSERADEIKNLINIRMDSVTDKIEKIPESKYPEVLFVYWSVKNGTTAVKVPPLSWMQPEIIRLAGGDPVWKDADTGGYWLKVNIEQIAAWNPDYIFVAAYNTPVDGVVNTILSDPAWSQLKAVKNSRLYAFPGDYHSWDQPDIRWLLGLQWVSSILHPEIFEGLDMEKEAESFYREMFFIDKEQFDSIIKPKLHSLNHG